MAPFSPTTYPSSGSILYNNVRPPTPAPSPPILESFPHQSPAISVAFDDPSPNPFKHLTPADFVSNFAQLPSHLRLSTLYGIIPILTPAELTDLQIRVAPLLKRDFLNELPTELALHVLTFLDGPKTVATAARVSRRWNSLIKDEHIWKALCANAGFEWPDVDSDLFDGIIPPPTTYRSFYKYSYTTVRNWKCHPRLLRTHRLPTHTDEPSVNTITSAVLSPAHLVAGLANSKIHIFNASNGTTLRTLTGHANGVWAVCLVTAGGALDPRHARLPLADVLGNLDRVPEVAAGLEWQLRHNRQPSGWDVSDPLGLDHLLPRTMREALGLGAPQHWMEESPEGTTRDRVQPGGASRGWGQPGALVVSGGCDKDVRVWDVETGLCIYVLRGHTSTVRSLRVLHNRPIAVSGARDGTLRVWDIQRGRMMHRLHGHTGSVRALEACGNQVVSGSYDSTCRLWDVDTGQCLQEFVGHIHQIYCVAFDGERLASGGVDTTVRVWDARSGQCLAMLQGHTALVCQLQMTPSMLITGGADGRVHLFSMARSPASPRGLAISIMNRIPAHDSSITALQLQCDDRLLVTGGADGKARLWEVETGQYVREMSEGGEGIWGLAFRKEVGAILCRRAGKMVVEVWSFKGVVD